jgi:predicted PurR-regulated permease PerM
MTDQQPTKAPSAYEGAPSWYRVWLPRAIVVVLVTLAVVAAASWIFEKTTGFLILVLMSFFLSFALQPAVHALTRRGWRRGAAAGLVLVGTALITLVFLVAMFGLVVSQTASLLEKAPGWINSITIWLSDNLSVEVNPETLQAEVGSLSDLVRNYGTDVASAVFGVAGSIVGLVFQALTMGLFVFYILADEPRLKRAIFGGFPPHRQRLVIELWDITVEKVGGYVYSRGVLAAISAVFHSIVFWIIGLPGWLALGLFVGVVSQFIPTVGTYIAGFVPTVVALLDDPIKTIWVLIAILAYQQLENYVLSPRVTAQTMQLHPAIAFGSAIVGASLLGIAGALLALPVAATITAAASTYARRYEIVDSQLLEKVEQEERGRWWQRYVAPEAEASADSNPAVEPRDRDPS